MKTQDCGTLQCAVVGQAREERKKSQKPFINFFFFCYISFQLTKKVPSFQTETCQDVLIHLFPGSLCNSSRSCLCSVALSQCGNSLPLVQLWIPHEQWHANRIMTTVWTVKHLRLASKKFFVLLNKLANYLNISLLGTKIITSLNFS